MGILHNINSPPSSPHFLPFFFAAATHIKMSRLLRPASRLVSSSSAARPVTARSAFQSFPRVPAIVQSRGYAKESGVKEYTVRDALNEALAEELESTQRSSFSERKLLNTMAHTKSPRDYWIDLEIRESSTVLSPSLDLLV